MIRLKTFVGISVFCRLRTFSTVRSQSVIDKTVDRRNHNGEYGKV
ncbi:MAG: hypothetical protein OSJ68_03810 [Clostridia bacterium]|nr:hypothetical protein [Clostridia bacterium]